MPEINHLKLKSAPALASDQILKNIISRVQAHAMTMIYLANHRSDIQKGDPKVGGHPTASSSALHLLSSLHLFAKNPQDYIACKPHASPTDHANNYLQRLFRETSGERMSDERARVAMKNLRHLPANDEAFFQSYHSEWDPDHWNYFPSGSVGIPPVQALYVAHAYRMASKHNYKIPSDAHFWCIMGDSEYREGSLMEALPEASERGLGNVTWIVDYNRQSLDGHRILNEAALGGKDNDRIEKTALANGWDVMQLKHGSFRQKIFSSADGEALKNVLESAMPDYEFNSLISKKDPATIIEAVDRYDRAAGKALKNLSGEDVLRFMSDLGGHDLAILRDAYEAAKRDSDKPMLIVAHTVKGWGLSVAAQSSNHSAMLAEEEIQQLRAKSGLSGKDLFAFERFDEKSDEGKYLKARGDWNLEGIQKCEGLKKENIAALKDLMTQSGALKNYPKEVGINLKMMPMVHTQWMLGQITAKLTRISETPLDGKNLTDKQKALTDIEKPLKPLAELLVTMAPDVGTSTNLNASMDGRIFGPDSEDYESDYGIKDNKNPDIVPHESEHSKHIRFDIAEGNAMTCVGSYGKMGELTGVPFMPVMTVYDFFIKRALDQFFYNAYWNASFLCVGTPCGVTLAPEGAQHAWKSDIQIANSITWEPAFPLEMDWILSETHRRHLLTFIEGKNSPNSNAGRSAVILRGVTRGLEHKEMLKRLKTQLRFNGQSDEQILEKTRQDCLEGAYYLVDYRAFPHYRPSENVVQLFAMGSLVTEALKATDELLKKGIYANVIMVTSPDLLLGNLAEKNGYSHLRNTLAVTGDLYLSVKNEKSTSYPPQFFAPTPKTEFAQSASDLAQLISVGGRRVPVVSVHDGEPGLLDNIGSVVGTLQTTLATRKHSKSGTPRSIYEYHHIDAASVATTCEKALVAAATATLRVDRRLAAQSKVLEEIVST